MDNEKPTLIDAGVVSIPWQQTTSSSAFSLEFVDADGHVLEHPTEMVDFAPRTYRQRIWHAETDDHGVERMGMDDQRLAAAGRAMASKLRAAFGRAPVVLSRTRAFFPEACARIDLRPCRW